MMTAAMRSRPTWLVVLLGVTFHAFFTWSIFDMYFRSPIVHGITSHDPPSQPPAKRVVLFVADGLRADKFFEVPSEGPRSPFLRSIITENGKFGVSHTRVPTESRPGHVALIAGFYEDMSALTKGWKANPVEFDHVFRHSSQAWAFGSPDIVPMFSSPDNVHQSCYSSEDEDMASVRELLDEASHNATLNEQLRGEKVAFFFHLLGIDMNGHAHRPYSKDYLENIRVVDEGIRNVTKWFSEFFGDEDTAFVFTSDHGMSDKGSHGDGERTNTETPLVVWGAGVASPKPATQLHPLAHDPFYPLPWGLDHLERLDVAQADVSPLMATLLGVPIPVNSVGVLPLDYLNATEKKKSQYLLLNARQIFSQYERKAEMKAAQSIVHHPFSNHDEFRDLFELAVEHERAGDYKQAQDVARQAIDLGLGGLNYYQKYDRQFLIVVVVASYFGWMAFLFFHTLGEFVTGGEVGSPTLSKIPDYVRYLLAIAVSVLLFLDSSPPQYYIYFGFLLYFWDNNASWFGMTSHVNRKWTEFKGRNKNGPLALSLLCIVVGLEACVLGFFYRWTFSIAFLGMPLLSLLTTGDSNASWTVCCIAMATFPFLPVDFEGNTFLVVVGGCALLGFIWFFSRNNIGIFRVESSTLLQTQCVLLFISVCIMSLSDYFWSQGDGLPLFNQSLAWILSICCPLLPMMSKPTLPDRFCSICLGFAVPFVFLSISFEMIFYACFVALLMVWISNVTSFEYALKQSSNAKSVTLNVRHFHIGFAMLLFTLISFFGTGNVATVSSFQISSTYRFTTSFNPFLMGGLLIFKILLPMIIANVAFVGLSSSLKLPHFAFSCMNLILWEFVAIHFFFLVKDEGSWKDIGHSISHYGITNLMGLFSLLLSYICTLFWSDFGKSEVHIA